MQQITNILVVEDRSDWQIIVGSVLEREGYTVHQATSYAAALEALANHAFALAIVDPVLDVNNRFNRDGLSVIKHIRSLQPQMQIAVITGSLTRDMRTSLQQLYPDAPVLLKESWEPVAFIELIHRLMGEQLSRRPVSTPEGPESLTVETSTTPAPPSEQECTPGCPRVLLVENRADWQTIVTSLLDRAGYFWRAADTAKGALNELEQESFHLIILDLKLQTNDLPLTSSEGWLLLDYIVEAHPTTSVLILSGKARPGDVAYLLTHYPVIGFIEKQNFVPQAIFDAVAKATQAPTLRLQTFGQFRIWRDGSAITGWERPQAETVVKMLLVRRAQGGRTVAADELITRLWPDSDEESGRKKLLPLISNARHTLEPDIEPRDSHFIVRSANGYLFDLGGHVNWDLLSFREHLRLGRQLFKEMRWEGAIEELQKAHMLYVGDFLAEDHYTDWIIELRREIASDFCHGLVVLADSYAALRRYPQAISACEAALQKDPLQESVYRRLMCLHFSNGDKGQAFKVYRACTTLFEELFGESPTPTTRTLYEAIVNDDPVACEIERWTGRA